MAGRPASAVRGPALLALACFGAAGCARLRPRSPGRTRRSSATRPGRTGSSSDCPRPSRPSWSPAGAGARRSGGSTAWAARSSTRPPSPAPLRDELNAFLAQTFGTPAAARGRRRRRDAVPGGRPRADAGPPGGREPAVPPALPGVPRPDRGRPRADRPVADPAPARLPPGGVQVHVAPGRSRRGRTSFRTLSERAAGDADAAVGHAARGGAAPAGRLRDVPEPPRPDGVRRSCARCSSRGRTAWTGTWRRRRVRVLGRAGGLGSGGRASGPAVPPGVRDGSPEQADAVRSGHALFLDARAGHAPVATRTTAGTRSPVRRVGHPGAAGEPDGAATQGRGRPGRLVPPRPLAASRRPTCRVPVGLTDGQAWDQLAESFRALPSPTASRPTSKPASMRTRINALG